MQACFFRKSLQYDDISNVSDMEWLTFLACHVHSRGYCRKCLICLKCPCDFLQARLASEEGAEEDAGRHAVAPPCLFSRAPSLEQAGGLRRLTLRGHAAGIVKVRTRRASLFTSTIVKAFKGKA